jgi:aspartyl-tRNA(Asn)/glutamyl-tRNA(Gln) amidotransferase subunit C
MKISEETVDHIAHLARLEFEGEKKETIKEDLERILQFIDKLKQLETNNVEPLVYMTNEVNRLREDETKVTLSQEEVLKNAPKKDSDYFRIPKVLEK